MKSRSTAERTLRGVGKRLAGSMAPGVFIAWLLFVLGPYTIFSTNQGEMTVPLGIVLVTLLPAAALAALGLMLPAILLPEGMRIRYVSTLAGLGLVLWVQGNLLVWRGGELGAAEVVLTPSWYRTWGEVALWVLAALIALVFAKRLVRPLTFLTMTLLALSGITTAVSIVRSPAILSKGVEAYNTLAPPEPLFEFSTSRNIIHIVLDELQTDVFEDILNTDPKVRSSLDGFVLYADTVGAFPTTAFEIPAILSGRRFEIGGTIDEFWADSLQGTTLPSVLRRGGYTVDLVMLPGFARWVPRQEASVIYSIPVPYAASRAQYARVNARKLSAATLFRYAPVILKPLVYRGATGGGQGAVDGLTEYERLRHIAHRQFVRDLTRRASVRRSGPVYKFIHLVTPHYPGVTLPNGELANGVLPWTWENIRPQAHESLVEVAALLNRLKSLGIYDSSLIVLDADHGYYKVPESAQRIGLQEADAAAAGFDVDLMARTMCAARPTLAIKLPNAHGGLRLSTAPVELTDIPATIADLAGVKSDFPGVPVSRLADDAKRDRLFAYYDSLNFPGRRVPRLDRFRISGPANKVASWHRVSAADAIGRRRRVQIDVGMREAGGFLESGWSWKPMEPDEEGRTYGWGVGGAAVVAVALPDDGPVRLTATMKTLGFERPQRVDVAVDGRVVGSWELSRACSSWRRPWQWDTQTLLIPADKRPPRSTIEFRFAQHRSKNTDPRPLAVLFDSIALAPAE
jgi:hypothetical protein